MNSTARTFVDILQQRAASIGGQPAFRFLPNGKADEAPYILRYADLAQRAAAIGAALTAENAAGERVILLYPAGLDFIEALFGVLYAGAAAVPIQAPQAGGAEAFQERLQRIIENCRARFILTDARLWQQLAGKGAAPGLRCRDTTAIDSLLADRWQTPALSSDSLAVLQYTSGSTGAPKGVCVSHANLLSNCAAIAEITGLRAQETHAAWMPHYHDMGLVTNIFCPVFAALNTVLMSPAAFIRHPVRWLEMIDSFKARTSGGPNFAYDLVLRGTSPEQRAALDLRHWQTAYCSAEPIRCQTMQAFVENFAVSGFRAESLLPCYGMAEATLVVTARYGARCLSLDADALTRGQARVSERDPHRVMSLGPPVADTEVHIMETEGGKHLGEKQIGEICLRGPGITRGYYGRSAGREFHAPPESGKTPLLRTGDLGFMYQNELYVCGRLKDLIIIRGQNLYPQDIERSIEDALPVYLDSNSVAAFGKNRQDSENLVVLIGLRKPRQDLSLLEGWLDDARQAVTANHGITPDTMAMVPARELPKTSSGKLQRNACRERWQQGEFRVLAQLPAKGSAEVKPAAAGQADRALPALVAEVLGCDPASLDVHRSFSQLGLDSLKQLRLIGEIERRFEREIPQNQLPQLDSIAALANFLFGPSEGAIATTRNPDQWRDNYPTFHTLDIPLTRADARIYPIRREPDPEPTLSRIQLRRYNLLAEVKARVFGVREFTVKNSHRLREALARFKRKEKRVVILARHAYPMDADFMQMVLARSVGLFSPDNACVAPIARAAIPALGGERLYQQRRFARMGLFPVSLPRNTAVEVETLKAQLLHADYPMVIFPEQRISIQSHRMIGEPPQALMQLLIEANGESSCPIDVLPMRLALRPVVVDTAALESHLRGLESASGVESGEALQGGITRPETLAHLWSRLALLTLGAARSIAPDLPESKLQGDSGYASALAAMRPLRDAIHARLGYAEALLGLPATNGSFYERNCWIDNEALAAKFPESACRMPAPPDRDDQTRTQRALETATAQRFLRPAQPYIGIFDGQEPVLLNHWRAAIDLLTMHTAAAALLAGKSPFSIRLPKIGRWGVEAEFSPPWDLSIQSEQAEALAQRLYAVLNPLNPEE